MKKLFTLAFVLYVLTGFSLKRNVPATYSTIQSALNACSIGDTVLVQPGNYQENIYWPKIKNIKLFSAGDSSNTFIDANFVGRCLTIIDSTKTLIDINTIISGFKLKNGYSDTTSFNGTAIYAYGTSFIIEKCAITNCNVNAINSSSTYTLSGGVIFFDGNVPTLRKTSIYGNNVYNSSGHIEGGLICVRPSTASSILNELLLSSNQVSIQSQGSNYIKGALIYCVEFAADQIRVINNKVDYIGGTIPSIFYSFLYGSGYGGSIKNSLIASNTFSASVNINMTCLVLMAPAKNGGASHNLTHLTIVDNKAMSTGSITAISFCGVNGTSSFHKFYNITNCIFWNPYNGINNEISRIVSSLNSFGVSFSNIRKYGAGIFPTNSYTINPQFVSGSDYHLSPASPLLSSGSYILNYDLDGNSRPLPNPSFPDIGCYEMNQPTSSITLSCSASTNTICEYQSPCFYNYTSKTKNRIWSIIPSVGGWPNVKDTACSQIYPAGTYTINLTVTDSSNAIGTSSFVITAYPIPTVSPISAYNNLCTGQSATLSSTYTGTTSTVLWSSGATSPTIVITPTVSGNYTFTYTNVYGCPRSGSWGINYTNTPAPTVTITPSSSLICSGQTVTLTASSTFTNITFSWASFGTYTSVVASPTVSTTYTVSAYNSSSCRSDTTQLITVSLCTGITSVYLNNKEIGISPNPNCGAFVLYSTIKENGAFEIYNCIGQIIKSGIIEEEKTKISLENNLSGIYFIKIMENKKIISTQKLILNN